MLFRGPQEKEWAVMRKQNMNHNWHKYLAIGMLLGLALCGCQQQQRVVYRAIGPAQPARPIVRAGVPSGYQSASALPNSNYGYQPTPTPAVTQSATVSPYMVSAGTDPSATHPSMAAPSTYAPSNTYRSNTYQNATACPGGTTCPVGTQCSTGNACPATPTTAQPSFVSLNAPQYQAQASNRVGQTGPQANAGDQELLEVYHIGPGDVLEIRIDQLLQLDEEAVLEVVVDPAGRVQLPVLNNVTVGGLTCTEVREALCRRLSQEFIRDPRATVEVAEYHSKEVMVVGAVGTEGTLVLQNDAATLMTVIAQAGGIQDDHADELMIVRGGYDRLSAGDGSVDVDSMISATNNGSGYEVFRIRVADLMGEGGQRLNPLVYPGDVVYVPSMENGMFYVTGAIVNPGSMVLQRPMNILQGIVAAGDTTAIASCDDCRVIRTLSDGQEIVIEVNLDRVRSGEEENFLLERNDVIVVPTDPFLAFLDGLGKMVQGGVSAGVGANYNVAN